VFVLDRPYKCTCLCLERPSMEVRYVENGQNVLLGTVTDQLSCKIDMQIKDPLGKILFDVSGSCC
jgi:hypothetical protein